MLREEDVRATYTRLTGVELGDLRWFYVLSAVMWGIFQVRGFARRVHFGEMPPPPSYEVFILHAPMLKRLLGESN